MSVVRPLILLTGLFLAGCTGNAAWPPVALDADGQAAAESGLYDRFLVIHDMTAQRPDALNQRLHTLAGTLGGVMPDAPDIRIEITNEPDADAGCLAGGWLYFSRGLVARLQSDDELAGIAALAATQCGQASRDWRRREEASLPPPDADNWLMHRYRDFRVDAGAPLYNSLVRSGCGEGNDCRARATEWLQAMGGNVEGLDRLLARVHEEWPDAALLERFAAAREQSATANPNPLPAGGGDGLVTDLGGLREQREGFDHLRQAWRDLIAGEITAGYRSVIDAGRGTGQHWVVRLMLARLDLINLHPYYAERRIREMRVERPDYPYYSFWDAWVDLQSKRWSQGIEKAGQSLEYLPRADQHFMLARILEFRRRPDEARPHYEAALAAGDLHPDTAEASIRLQALQP